MSTKKRCARVRDRGKRGGETEVSSAWLDQTNAGSVCLIRNPRDSSDRTQEGARDKAQRSLGLVKERAVQITIQSGASTSPGLHITLEARFPGLTRQYAPRTTKTRASHLMYLRC